MKELEAFKKFIQEESKSAYGSEIDNLRKGLAPDEDIKLTDDSDQLKGDVVKKTEYVINMLSNAIEEKDWSKVGNAISYIRVRMK
jgi:hypothetical protein